MDQVSVSDVARAILALDDEEAHLRAQQMALAQLQYKTWLRLEAIATAKTQLWSKRHERQ